jgi:signal transduction histidine kinase
MQVRRDDLVLPLFLAVAIEIELLAAWGDQAGAGELICAPMIAAPLAVRRHSPLAALLGPVAIYPVLVIAGLTLLIEVRSIFITLLVCLYVYCAEVERRSALLGWLAVAAAEAVALLVGGDNDGFWQMAAILLSVPALAGMAVRRHRVQSERLRELAERLDREQEENARLAVVEERARIARELHDVLAHSLSVMVLQADGGRGQIGSDPAAERRAFESIERTGREALAESRRLLGVLREGDGASPLDPQPGMANLTALVERTRAAGLDTELVVEGEPRELPPGLDLASYRIVQEALTNSVRHARAEHASVRVSYGATALELDLTDDGQGAADNGRGHGLLGMRERAALYGGELHAGSRPEGGFRVHARLPLAP